MARLPGVRSNIPRGQLYATPAKSAKDYGESDRTRSHSPRRPRDLDRVVRAAVRMGLLTGEGTLTRRQYYAVLGCEPPT